MLLSFNWHSYSFVFGIQKKNASGRDCAGHRKENTGAIGIMASNKARTNTERYHDLFQIAESAREKIKSGIREAGRKRPCKRELLTNLQQLLKPYAALADLAAHPFRVAINNVIQTESVIYCSIHLNNEELNFLWRKVR